MAKRRFRGYAKTAWANRGRYYGKAKGLYGKTGLTITPTFLAGVGAALVLPDNEMLTVGTLAGATLPVRGLGPVKGFSQGYVLGQLAQKYILPKLGINFGNVMGGNTSYSNIV